MRQLLHYWILAFGLGGAIGSAHAEGFLSCVDNLPLAPGLLEAEEGCLNFDTAVGRVAQAEARGTMSATEVRRFYHLVLPAFGWKLLEPDRLDAIRAGERLKISVEVTDSGELRVHYALTPSPGT